jgi:hypothetical protein
VVNYPICDGGAIPELSWAITITLQHGNGVVNVNNQAGKKVSFSVYKTKAVGLLIRL